MNRAYLLSTGLLLGLGCAPQVPEPSPPVAAATATPAVPAASELPSPPVSAPAGELTPVRRDPWWAPGVRRAGTIEALVSHAMRSRDPAAEDLWDLHRKAEADHEAFERVRKDHSVPNERVLELRHATLASDKAFDQARTRVLLALADRAAARRNDPELAPYADELNEWHDLRALSRLQAELDAANVELLSALSRMIDDDADAAEREEQRARARHAGLRAKSAQSLVDAEARRRADAKITKESEADALPKVLLTLIGARPPGR